MSMVKIAVLGGGHGAHTMAADLSLRGFRVAIYEMPQYKHKLEELFDTKTIELTGVIKGVAKLDCVTSDVDEALDGAKYIHIVVPAFAHGDYAKLLKNRVKIDQVLTVFPGTFGSLTFREALGEGPVIAETDTLPYDTRMIAPCKASVFGLNPTNIAFKKKKKARQTLSEMLNIYPYKKLYQDVLECGLSSINPALHSGPCLLNLGPIEYWARGQFYLYEHGFTPSAARVNKVLDNERKAIGERFGYKINAMEEFAGMPENWTWQDMYRTIHGSIALTPISGPSDINNRYLTEDAPFGLVTWSSIGKQVGVATPTIDSIINIYCIVHEKNWWKEGRTARDLGIAGMSTASIKKYLQTGKKLQS